MIDPGRRFFLRGGLRSGATPTDRPRPPWSRRPDGAFTDACTRCGECVKACPEAVLRPGDGGFPEIDFSAAGCSLCGACSRACASGAIGPAAAGAAFPWRVEVGDACLNRHAVECRLCGDACEAGALRFRPAPGGISHLLVDREACTGCGACIGICPVGATTLRAAPAPGDP